MFGSVASMLTATSLWGTASMIFALLAVAADLGRWPRPRVEQP
ncbi:hypothetical protein ACWIGW_32060 [Nocardia brasiliensis]